MRKFPAFARQELVCWGGVSRLLDAGGKVVVGDNQIGGQEIEKRAITAPDAVKGAAPIGWLGIVAPGAIQNSTDAFFLRSQFRSLLYAAVLALVLSGIGAALLARGFLVPIRALERGAKRLAGGRICLAYSAPGQG